MNASQFALEVVVHGHPISEHTHQGDVFVEGRRGSEYVLRARNNTPHKALVVLSVDGLSVMDGQAASRNSSGYVIRPYDSVEIPGWRLNDHDVACFTFGSLPEAYASQMGKPKNIGVIGAVFYREKKQRAFFRHDMSDSPLRGGGMKGGGTFGGIGTGFGRREEHQVTHVQFERENEPAAQMVLRYDDRDGLERRGIRITAPHATHDRVVAANPFPADTKGCPLPQGWRG